MIEHEQLLKLASGDDDAPVSFCIVKNGERFDWKQQLPDEVLYIPESIFERIAPAFMSLLGRDYYGTVPLSQEELDCLLSSLLVETPNADLLISTREIRRFISHAGDLAESHYVVFEGP